MTSFSGGRNGSDNRFQTTSTVDWLAAPITAGTVNIEDTGADTATISLVDTDFNLNGTLTDPNGDFFYAWSSAGSGGGSIGVTNSNGSTYIAGNVFSGDFLISGVSVADLNLAPSGSVWFTTEGGDPISVTHAAVPEPSSALLLGLGAFSWVILRKRIN